MTALPAPAPGRWRPLRIGLVDLFHYDVEEFWFHDGRLLLRGNNGTGKSKVLALTLPFLLDGDLSARRVEPDGDPGKRMEWNLLLGGEHPHQERLGYTWIEFGRRDGTSGEEHFRTLLCGLKAVSGRGIARHWFAVTDQRIGTGPGLLGLLDATGTALSRDRLAEAIGSHGLVHDTAKAYRRAVDEALFGLGERRYGALVDLLIQLRQPQLSKRPNEAALSRALTEALPPVDQAVIADVAEAFRSLDEEKAELVAASEAERAASVFLDHYRRYARVATRRRARLPRSEHARYEQLRRDLAQAQGERARAVEDGAAAEASASALEERAVRLSAQEAALRAGPEMRDARALEQAAEDAARTAAERTRADRDFGQADAAHRRAVERLAEAENRVAAAERAVSGLRIRVGETASAGRLAGELVPDGVPEAELRRTTAESTDRRRRTVEHLEELLERVSRAEAEHRASLRRVDEAQEEVVHSGARLAEAEENVAGLGAALVDDVRDHLAACVELPVPDLPGLLDGLQEWVATLEGPNPARTTVSRAHRGRVAELADHAAGLSGQADALAEGRARCERELTTLERGGQAAPEAPRTRSPGVRDGQEGAPLWRLVEFRDAVPDGERAGLEAALEASGLLDAWVRPDGTAMGPDGHDIFLEPDSSALGQSLGDALNPSVDQADARAAAVGVPVIRRLLAAIGLVPTGGAPPESRVAGTWVSGDGRFRVGALTGSWTKTTAEYVGEGAREAARRARMEALRVELVSLGARTDEVNRQLRETESLRRTLDDELASFPDDDALRTAHALVTAATDATHRARARHESRTRELAEAVRGMDAATEELDTTAADVGLPADRDGLAVVRRALAELSTLLAEFWPALRARAEARRSAETESAETERAAARGAEFAERAGEAAQAAEAADARHATLVSTVGAAVAELQRRLAETAEETRTCARELKTAQDARAEADRRASHAEGRADQLAKGLTDATAARERAIAALRRFAATGLLHVALPGAAVPDTDNETWAATPAIALARAVETELSGVDDSDGAWERVQKRLSEEFVKLQDALSRNGHSASGYPSEDGMRVDIVYQGRRRAIEELTEALAAEVEELTRILSAHEREVLENHLITEVAGTLRELIGAAERQVSSMNAELDERPTSTGMRLRLVWRGSRKAPPGLTQVRERLRQSEDAWSPEDRVAVGEFLQTQIARQQADGSSGSWLEDLTAALDYRAWHEFGVERQQHGKWVSATGPASGGERVLAASVPLFAAASSHYASARGAYAPRLVTLDEAFAGVDDDSRAKCLGLLHAFDLDVVMTSEREWACYPQVPGIAIAQLSRVDGIAAVLVTRWEWDGTERTRGAEPDSRGDPWDGTHPGAGESDDAEGRGPVTPGAGAAVGPRAQEGLWE
ncbi:TIGR02680 family protein [Streptomyces sedi]|uniref:TIGR02680 family protein n=1 Tax=Streptomyces sedi TaxID=555059 RepID=A0A5C4VB39_9ACTN|nr:TIGR02680 family protein [Streptomyces sedi]TNM32775.1 TIGR02680 family protein [Streptomyces sedi]